MTRSVSTSEIVREEFREDQQGTADLSERVKSIIGNLEKEAERRVQRRAEVEARWIEDLQLYHGIYDEKMRARLDAAGGSKVFMNFIATKTDALVARLWDLLFPTDDRAWSVDPTPVPALAREIEKESDRIDDLEDQASQALAVKSQAEASGDAASAEMAANMANGAYAEIDAVTEARDALQAVIDEAQARADLMQEEIEDQLVQCLYQTEAREVIHNGAVIGFGVLKGPVLGQNLKQRWQPVESAEGGAIVYQLSMQDSNVPAAYSCDPWGYFPDPDTPRVEDSEGHYERHLLTKQQMRKLARRADIDSDEVRELLTNSTPKSVPGFMSQLSSLTGEGGGQIGDRYQVWEYTGPIDGDDLRTLAEAGGDMDLADEMGEVDPLDEVNAKVWFCDGRVLSFAIHPLDSGEPIYSVFTIKPDPTSPFGYGLPYIGRNPQSVINAGWRMMIDNAALATGPQVLVDKSQVTPADGVWQMTARKVWNWIKGTETNRPPFSTFSIDMHQVEIANLIQMAREAMDEITSMPAIAQGEQGTDVTKTAQGMALLMNSANVTFRRIVKTFDDNVTTPVIRRFYHFNMQFSEKEEIKGDLQVQARGSSVLLVREMQAQNLMMIALQFGGHPIYGPMLKNVDLLRQIFRAHAISPDEVMKTMRQIEQDAAEAGETPDPAAMAQQMMAQAKERENDLREMEIQQKGALTELEWDRRLEIAAMNYDVAMTKAAEAMNISRDKLDEMVSVKREQIESGERRLAAEVAMQERTGVSSGGAV